MYIDLASYDDTWPDCLACNRILKISLKLILGVLANIRKPTSHECLRVRVLSASDHIISSDDLPYHMLQVGNPLQCKPCMPIPCPYAWPYAHLGPVCPDEHMAISRLATLRHDTQTCPAHISNDPSVAIRRFYIISGYCVVKCRTYNKMLL